MYKFPHNYGVETREFQAMIPLYFKHVRNTNHHIDNLKSKQNLNSCFVL